MPLFVKDKRKTKRGIKQKRKEIFMLVLDTILYVSLFLMGTVFGSFFTLAVHRIPKKEDITHVRSYCPKCGQKLQFWDLIPVWSYLFLGGKCRYCKEKIRIRYLLLEVLSGITFLLVALTNGIHVDSTGLEFLNLAFIYLFLTGMFIIAGIDKEKKTIPDGVILYEFIVAALYLAFRKYMGLPVMSHIYGFVLVPGILMVVDLLIWRLYKDENKLPFGVGDIKYIAVLNLFLGIGKMSFTIILSILWIAVYLSGRLIVESFKKKESRGGIDKMIPWGFYLTIAGTMTIVLEHYVEEIMFLLEY